MCNSLKIRRAGPEDAPILTAWESKAHVKAATSDDPSIEDDWDWFAELMPRDDGTEFYLAIVCNHPIGYMCSIDPARERTGYWGPIGPNFRALDIIIGEEEYLGQCYGTQMMHWMIERCFNDPKVGAILIDPLASNKRAHRFYEKLGFAFQYRQQFDATSDCYVMKLVRSDWRSP